MARMLAERPGLDAFGYAGSFAARAAGGRAAACSAMAAKARTAWTGRPGTPPGSLLNTGNTEQGRDPFGGDDRILVVHAGHAAGLRGDDVGLDVVDEHAGGRGQADQLGRVLEDLRLG